MKRKTFKWLWPIFAYICYMGLIYLMSVLEVLIYGHRHSDGPTLLPEWGMFILFFPLIPFGYILLPIMQRIYRKGRKWFKVVAYTLLVLFAILCTIHNKGYIFVSGDVMTDFYVDGAWISVPVFWSISKRIGYYLLIDLTCSLSYFFIFFMGLYHILTLKKSKKYPNIKSAND